MAVDVRDSLQKGSHPLPESWAWEWFTDVMDVEGGTQPPASQFISQPKPGYVRLVQIRDFESDGYLTYIPDSTRWKKCSTTDVLIARYGAALGRICRGLEGAYNVALAKVVPNDRVKLPFAYYLLTSNYFQAPLMASGGRSAQSGFNKADLGVIALPVPTIRAQQAIADVLGTLDEKIRLNRRINGTLESIARSIFKSWFVDFDPVRAKLDSCEAAPLSADIAELFPDSFEHTPDGDLLPTGWRMAPLNEIAEMRNKSVKPGSKSEQLWEHYSIPGYDEGREPKRDRGESIKSGKYVVPENSVLISKLNPQFPRVWMPNPTTRDWAICSTEFMPFVPVRRNWRSYLYELAWSQSFQTEIQLRATGSTGSRQRVRPKDISNMDVINPGDALISCYSELVSPLHHSQIQNIEESNVLAALRDTLLPQLLSGNIHVHDAEKEAAKVL